MPRLLRCPAYEVVEEGERHVAYHGAVPAPILLHKVPYPIPDKSDIQFPSAAAAIVDIPSVTPRVVSMYSPCSAHTVEEEEQMHTPHICTYQYADKSRRRRRRRRGGENEASLAAKLSARESWKTHAHTHRHTYITHTNLQQ